MLNGLWIDEFVSFLFQLHLAALASLKGDIVELNKRLQQTEKERDLLEKKLAKAQVRNILKIILGFVQSLFLRERRKYWTMSQVKRILRQQDT